MTIMHHPSSFQHEDQFSHINQPKTLDEKLAHIHATLRERFPFIHRIALAVYDPATDMLKTFLQSGVDGSPLSHYEATLGEASSLREILEHGRPRVINNMSILAAGVHEHTQRLAQHGYQASYTMPMCDEGVVFGFLFFNSHEPDCFTEPVLSHLDPIGHLISLTVSQQLSHMRTLLATVRTARDVTHARDGETGGHLDRMSRFARLIAQALAEKYSFTDEYIEKVFWFSPLHDIGKIAIPDRVLLKPAALDTEERALMQTHPRRGQELIDRMLDYFALEDMHGIDILRNIALYHHETMDGAGYPEGRRGVEIPIEARIVAVADIFDALTSIRPYKPAWTNDEAFATLQQLAAIKLDPDCVQALIDHRAKVEEIQRTFNENRAG